MSRIVRRARTRRRRNGRRRAVVAVASLLVVLGVVPASARPDPGPDPDWSPPRTAGVDGIDAARGQFRWPVDGALVAAFAKPESPWSPGHRGVDLAVTAGQRVRAMGDGVVGFAGVVAGRAWVSIDHPQNLRTTVGPLAVVGVRAGAVVRRGRVVGTAAATAHADAGTVHTRRLHVSARVAGTYVDPTPLVAPWVASLVLPPG